VRLIDQMELAFECIAGHRSRHLAARAPSKLSRGNDLAKAMDLLKR